MRILGLRFQNLNSLAGEWDIDLTRPEYEADGIFAVIGPTGAGKTTIFDALCLALYGSTPRLGKVTKSVNDIMSRRHGKCFAEVTFSVNAARYRCQWSQRRAREKADGTLQDPKHELAEADSGRIIASGAAEVPKHIAEITGLDFQRFTRSMLLAQGDFAAFLQAQPDEKAQILEKITGSEIYRLISMEVHARKGHAAQAFERRKEQLAGLVLLDDDEERALRDTVAAGNSRDEALARELDALSSEAAWLEGIMALERDLAALATQKLAGEAAHAAFAPERLRLDRGEQAETLRGDHALLEQLLRDQGRDQAEERKTTEALPEAERRVEEADTLFRAAGETLRELGEKQQALAVLLRHVRSLDQSLTEKGKRRDEANHALREAHKDLTALQNEHESAERLLAHKESELRTLTRFQEENAGDAILVEQLGVFMANADELHTLAAASAARKAACAEQAQRCENARTALLTARDTHSALSRSLQTLGKEYAETSAAQSARLEGKDLPWWRAQLEAARERCRLLRAVQDTLAEHTARTAEKALRETRIRELEALGARIVTEKQEAARDQARLEEKAALLETQVLLLQKIHSLDAARNELADGEPCPLCGALHHPYAEGAIPRQDESARELAETRVAAKKATANLAALSTQEARTNSERELLQKNSSEDGHRISRLETEMQRLAALLGICDAEQKPAHTPDPQREPARIAAMAPELAQAAEARRAAITSLLETAEHAEVTLRAMHSDFETRRTALHAAETALRQRELEERHARETETRLCEEYTAGEKTLKARREHCAAALAPWFADAEHHGAFINEFTEERSSQILAALTERKNAWQTAAEKMTALEGHVATGRTRNAERAKRMAVLEAERARHEALAAGIREEYDALSGERARLFGAKNPDHEEEQSRAAVAAAEKALEEARKNRETLALTLEAQRARLAALRTTLAEREPRLHAARTLFSERLRAGGFTSDADFAAALLDANELALLRSKARELETREIERAARAKEKQEALAAEKAKRPPTADAHAEASAGRDIAALQAAMLAARHSQKTVREEIGATAQRLADNEATRQRHGEYSALLEADKQEHARWALLHELIGSGDGKKYRNFAQSLTLETVIRQANRELRAMSDRYELIRDTDDPLNINVIDGYQAGEIRPARTLSGGESFIISLALALGLSRIAGRNVRVDSLFLDEGFGTLDEEALDTALTTLAGLQRHGKLIGIISHVPALRERIAARIEVIPRAEGRSIIEGPGCSGGLG